MIYNFLEVETQKKLELEHTHTVDLLPFLLSGNEVFIIRILLERVVSSRTDEFSGCTHEAE
jgi:hypothetical protein